MYDGPVNADEARRLLKVPVDAGPEALETAWQARRIELESAYRRLAGRAPPALPGSEGDGGSTGPAPKSYLRATFLTLVFPGAGSWYAGGRARGLLACGVSTLVLAGLLLAVRSSLTALPAATGLTQRMTAVRDALGEFSIGFQWLMLVALGDAWLATWAHNDRLRTGGVAAPPPEAGPPSGSGPERG